MKRSQKYPRPLVVEPLQEHRQSFIILHGRGSNAETFGPPLLQTELPDGRTLQQTLPNAKFVFPTASFRRAVIFKRTPITQWFDNYSLEEPAERPELQVEGLRETSELIHELLRDEIKQVGPNNVVLGGLSQGCAATLIALLLWTGEPICAAFGMSGWLPFRCVLAAANESYSLRDGNVPTDDIFDRKGLIGDVPCTAGETAYTRAVRELREELDVPFLGRETIDHLPAPVFLGHGAVDEKVVPTLGERACQTLSEFGNTVTWKKYDELGHWYHGHEIADIVAFVRLQGLSE